LIGQPELDELLDRPDLRQLKQRIVFAEYLKGIERNQLARYLDSRLRAAGYKGSPLFSRSALQLLYRASGGVPRLINVLAHKAMLVAYGQASDLVRRSHMARAVADTRESRFMGRCLARHHLWFWPLMAAVAAVALALVLSLFWQGGW